MNEAGYIRSVHRALANDVYKWKIADRFTVGIPDCWYSGLLSSLFVEYKYVAKTPKKTKPKLSGHQQIWLNRRLAENQNVGVIIGSPDGGRILMNGEWNSQILMRPLLPPAEIAAWIRTIVVGEPST